MSKLEDSINNSLKKLLEINDIEELNTTSNLDGGVGPIKTPKAFCDDCEEDESNSTKKPKSNFKEIAEDLYLAEVSYKEYKKDDSKTPKQKINDSIKTINRHLFEISKLLNQNIKLKTEMGVSKDHYWKSTKQRLSKISERILKVAKQFRDISA